MSEVFQNIWKTVKCKGRYDIRNVSINHFLFWVYHGGLIEYIHGL